MDQLVQFFFKHERAVFTNGEFGLDARPSFIVAVSGVLVIGVVVYLVYARPRGRLKTSAVSGLIAIRVALLALLALLLLRPVIVVSSVVPRSSYVAILADDSRSMQLSDEADGRSRLDAVKQRLLAPEGSFLRRLEDKFKTNMYAFSGEVTKLRDARGLFGEGASTDITGAVEDVVKNSVGEPLSAVVVVSDGASNTPRDLAEQLRNLRARNLPVYTVGVGSATEVADAEMMRVNAPRRVIAGSSISAEALVRLNGYEQGKVLIAISENGRALKTQELNLRRGETQAATVELTPATAGLHRYTFAITPLENELTIDNNAQDVLVEVVDGPIKVLYVEGEPRWEYGKLRAALTRNEKTIVLVSMLRSGENKLYRQGVEGESELADGFPKTEEELFAYHGVVLGSVESAYFTAEQLAGIEAFVARRGGGLIALGGRNAFDAGRYAQTPLADLLPLRLTGRAEKSPDGNLPGYKAVLTARGRTHAVTRLHEDRALNQKAWDELPAISVPEVLTSVKPGATVLLEARRANEGERGSSAATVPLLVEERYGRGRTLALTASDTWRWQMRMDSKSNAHETFWRQTLRYLVSTSPDQFEIAAERDVYAPQDVVRIVAEVKDKKFEAIKDAKAAARVLKPSGETIEVVLQFVSRDDANYFTGEFTPDEVGMHRVELSATKGATTLGAAQSSFLVNEMNRESHDAAQNVELLKRVAAETGGKYYTLAEAGTLIDDLTYRQSDNSERVTKELWDMPINFLLLVGLASAEWFLRKREGLA